jgi:SpoVK/Ycf46/Vps4 family AAA+-type ATPase
MLKEEKIDLTISEEEPQPLKKLSGSVIDQPINTNSKLPTHWSELNDNEFLPAYPVINTIPSGFYDVVWNSGVQQFTLKNSKLNIDELFELPSKEIEEILTDIDNFWLNNERYKTYGFTHKRGILMYGEPGCGKSGLINLITKRLIKNNGLVININDENSMDGYLQIIPKLRNIEPNRPIIVIIEDIDGIAGTNSRDVSRVLNLLDGNKQISNVVYIATTNYPERLEERITNRPSRFDRRFKIDPPNREVRESYIKNKLTKEDLEKINIQEWLDETEGLSLSHLKELIISVIVTGREFNNVIGELNNLKIKPSVKYTSEVGFGKK